MEQDASVWSRLPSKSAASDRDHSEAKSAPRSRQCRSKWGAGRHVAITQNTLTEVVMSRDQNSGRLFGRGDELEREVATWDLRQTEVARNRLNAAKQASLLHRARAHDRRQRRRQAQEDQQKGFVRPLARMPSMKRPCNLDLDGVDSQDEDQASNPASPRSREGSSSCESPAPERLAQRPQLRRLNTVQFHTPRSERLQRLDRAVKERQRILQHQVRRQKEFEALPAKERNQLRRAFKRASGATRSSASATLDCPAKLVDCLEELGLRGSTERERAVVQDLCLEFFLKGELCLHTFALDLVPRARDVIRKVRQGALLKQFFVFDIEGNGIFGKKECVDFLERLYRDNMDGNTYGILRDRFLGLYDYLKTPSAATLDLRGFQALMGQAEAWRESMCAERELAITEKYKLSPEDLECAGDELLVLHESFELHDHNGNGNLDEMEVVGSLLESGLVPRCGKRKATIGEMIHQSVLERGSRGMDFRSFMTLIGQVRQVCQREAHDELWEVFHGPAHDEADNIEISMPQACRYLAAIGHAPRTQQEQDAIKKLMDRVDLTPSGQLDFKSFQTLVQRVAEKLRAGQRWRENELGRTLGFGPQAMAELRASFFGLDADGNGVLDLLEFKAHMRRSMSPSEIESLFESFDIDYNGSLNFTEYLYFAKHLDDPAFDLKAALAGAAAPGSLLI